MAQSIDPKISQHVAQLYQNLYSSTFTPSHIEPFLDNISADSRKINDDLRVSSEEEISLAEISECIKSLQETNLLVMTV